MLTLSGQVSCSATLGDWRADFNTLASEPFEQYSVTMQGGPASSKSCSQRLDFHISKKLDVKVVVGIETTKEPNRTKSSHVCLSVCVCVGLPVQTPKK